MLYHKELGFPEKLQFKSEYALHLKYTQHAKRASQSDRYGKIELPKYLIFNRHDIIEVETDDNKIIKKVVVRTKYNKKYDLCLAILLENNIVKTVWLNSVEDKHKTLNKSKYEKSII